jgi:hydroxyacylglutathione hydrolase
MMEHYNRSGVPPLAGRRRMRPLTPAEVAGAAGEGALIVDIRGPSAFAGGHVPDSLHIWSGGLSSYLGYFASYDRPIVFIDESNLALKSAEVQALRIGFDRIAGYLGGGMAAWSKSGRPIGRCGTCSVREVDLHAEEQFILDVRDIRNRLAAGAIPGSYHLYAGEIEQGLPAVPKDRHILVYCDAGFKGSLAASVLLRNGYERVTNILGGMAAWKRAGLPVERTKA